MHVAQFPASHCEGGLRPARRAASRIVSPRSYAMRCFRPSSGCSQSGLELPVVDYDRSGGSCSVTGGVVYRGCRMPGYAGTYFYADYCSAFVRSFRLEGGRAVDSRDWTTSLGRGLDSPTSFGVDADGEAYIVDRDGELYRIVPAG